MTSRPGRGTQETSHQHGDAGVSESQSGGRPARAMNPVNTQIQPSQDSVEFSLEGSRRPGEGALGRPRGPAITTKPASGAAKDTLSNDIIRPVPSGKPQLLFDSVSPVDVSDVALPSHFGSARGAAQSLSLPPRPGHSRVSGLPVQQRLVPGGSGVKDAANRTTPPSENPPSEAQVLPGGSKRPRSQSSCNPHTDTMSQRRPTFFPGQATIQKMSYPRP